MTEVYGVVVEVVVAMAGVAEVVVLSSISVHFKVTSV